MQNARKTMSVTLLSKAEKMKASSAKTTNPNVNLVRVATSR
jgi:hypothetical protein